MTLTHLQNHISPWQTIISASSLTKLYPTSQPITKMMVFSKWDNISWLQTFPTILVVESKLLSGACRALLHWAPASFVLSRTFSVLAPHLRPDILKVPSSQRPSLLPSPLSFSPQLKFYLQLNYPLHYFLLCHPISIFYRLLCLPFSFSLSY
jgi:hypothetical protein